MNQPNVCTFMGSVGEDEYAKILESKSRAAGVNVNYQITKEIKSGTCAVLVNGQNRWATFGRDFVTIFLTFALNKIYRDENSNAGAASSFFPGEFLFVCNLIVANFAIKIEHLVRKIGRKRRILFTQVSGGWPVCCQSLQNRPSQAGCQWETHEGSIILLYQC